MFSLVSCGWIPNVPKIILSSEIISIIFLKLSIVVQIVKSFSIPFSLDLLIILLISFDSGSWSNHNNYRHYFDGKLDEFRVTNSVLSADYIKNSYNTQNDPTNFVREGIHLSESISLTDSTSEIKSSHLDKDQITKIMSLSGVKQYPMRVKCATLAWHTLTSAIEEKKEEVNTEAIDLWAI